MPKILPVRLSIPLFEWHCQFFVAAIKALERGDDPSVPVDDKRVRDGFLYPTRI